MMPSGMATTIAMTVAMITSQRVIGSRSRIMSVTCCFWRNDSPRSPWTALPTHLTYSETGSPSRPYFSRMLASVSADTRLPPTMISAGSPGASRTIPNVTNETNRRIGINARRRFRV